MKRKLHFGCGHKVWPDWDNADHNGEGNLTFDFETFPYPIKDDTYDLIRSDNVLEHMLHPLEVIKELCRISKNGATISLRVPYYNSGGAFNDPTHYHYYNERTFYKIPELLGEGYVTVKSVELMPTKVGRFIPKFIRNKLCFFIGTIVGAIEVRYIVSKR